MKTLPKIRITSSKKEGTKVYQDDVEIKYVVSYQIYQDDPNKMPMVNLEVLAPVVEIELEEAEVIEETVEATEKNTKKEIEVL